MLHSPPVTARDVGFGLVWEGYICSMSRRCACKEDTFDMHCSWMHLRDPVRGGVVPFLVPTTDWLLDWVEIENLCMCAIYACVPRVYPAQACGSVLRTWIAHNTMFGVLSFMPWMTMSTNDDSLAHPSGTMK